MDEGEFGRLVDRHYPGLVQRLTLVMHDADDGRELAQEAYLRAYRARHRFEGADARAWLHTIGLRLAFDRLRRRRLLRTLLAGSSQDAPAWVTPERIDLWNAIGGLRPEVRAALLLNVLDGYTQAEIAGMLARPAGTIATWIASAKEVLRAELRDQEEVVA